MRAPRAIALAAGLVLLQAPGAIGAERTGTTAAPLLSTDGTWSARKTVRLPQGPDGTVAALSWLVAYPAAGPVVAEICVGRRCLETDRPEVYDDRRLAGIPLGPVTLRVRTAAPDGGPRLVAGLPIRISVTLKAP
ncbi:hypothetical protein [Mongoliimonas terrestris]|uniref:hypothetical protein n=1 Tax=Mongoliimonas terrestris TaxID=1709001 RepID=UPI000949ABEB|nr:hypothetical protein [Mongoliimonas terrestris]